MLKKTIRSYSLKNELTPCFFLGFAEGRKHGSDEECGEI